ALVMTGGYLPGTITKSEGNIEQAESKGLIVIVDASEIDEAGNTVYPVTQASDFTPAKSNQ
ncbi:MAG TPA: hypothetical protein VLD18_13455, partial [Verrucomicrobiae bacterium]|nr:hypothetical protein [Verrucomicrobiae bacterium]